MTADGAYVFHPWLVNDWHACCGCQHTITTHNCAAQLGVRGVLVLSAREGGPASKAGIKGTSRDGYGRLVLGDIIVAFNGTPVKYDAGWCSLNSLACSQQSSCCVVLHGKRIDAVHRAARSIESREYTSNNAAPIRSASDLYRVLDKCKVGDQVFIEVLRDSAKENVTVTLEANT